MQKGGSDSATLWIGHKIGICLMYIHKFESITAFTHFGEEEINTDHF